MTINHTPLGAGARVRAVVGAWAPVLALIAICVALGFGGDDARAWGRYQREAIEAGQIWRLVSAHLVHLSWSHLALNLAALVLIRLLVGDALTAADWLGATLVAALAIDLGLYVVDTGVDWYVGLSGVLHGLMIVSVVALVPRDRGLALLLTFGLIGKLIWEQTSGPLPWSVSTSGGPVIVAAHLYGAAGGAVYALADRAVRGRAAASL